MSNVAYQNTLDRALIERELDAGRVWARMTNGRLWRVRRNGRTQTWKTRPTHYRIPVKAGLRSCGAIEHTSVVRYAVAAEGADFVIDLA